MPKLRNITKDSAKLKIEFEGEDPLLIEYHPKRVTDELLLAAAGFDDVTASTIGKTTGDFNFAMSELIGEWNLEDDDGIVYPLTPEGVARVYPPIKTLILQKIKEDMEGRPKN